MKILIITGQLATPIIKENLKNYEKHDIYIKTLPMQIAAFITVKQIKYYLDNEKILHSINGCEDIIYTDVDMIITPGLIQEDVALLNELISIETYKGPTNAADIEFTLDIIGDVELSTKKPANILIRQRQYERSMQLIEDANNIEKHIELLKSSANTMIGNIPTGLDFPMRILGEIANAPTLSDNELLDRVAYYIDSGADMIDVGLHAGGNDPEMAYHLVKTIKDNFNDDVTVSIDTLNPSEIKRALDAEADLVLSLDHGNYMKIKDEIKAHNVKAVILPTNYSKNIIPKTPKEKIDSLNKLDMLCSDITTIADPLLDPINSPSLSESIVTCYEYRRQNPEKLLFFGVGNVTELLDCDSNGANAVLGGIAMELGVSILFTPEASLKTKSSICELKVASNMMYVAKEKNTIPKDVGINLIKYKDSYKKDDLQIDTTDIPEIKAVADGKFIPDYKGSFKIIVEDNLIKAVLFKDYEKSAVITATTAQAIYEEILRRDLISRIEHAAYLGMELQKAEYALKLKKQYIQDFPLFD
ncbi:MAG: dihydropteroate synthase-like protein [Methanosphaera sp.]|uniref:dihydropteroate synthase-like protein n=1 Tax=Methanosphaera sp. TaxID=2666342 RepID=UPI0025CB7EDB|nr:dihydropteroate synthase-like protein [Methanosphaera sp.]MCI5866971.1 dihydropteroate synthase-like protein [Methanosphaera sp.]MDD6533914.1 dihydropteroate synthase-like protein [Methanosphaera sp.]MDY3956276.1 dihydropteroate synthase-like protein [Methanosphaera sp.]